MKKLFLTVFISLCVLSSLHAQNSPVISYQGLIQGADGAPIKDSTYPITVLIWRDTTQGTPIWQDVFQTEVRGGVFNILLGSQSPLPAPSDMDHPLWISTSIGEASAAYPRSALSAVPMAINVADRSISTNKVIDSAITTAKLADSSVTPQKMNMNYVSSISVNGQQVTGNGTALNITGGDGVGVLFDPNTNSLYLSSGTNAGTGKGDGKTLSLGDSDWHLNGNSSTSPPTDFIGTLDAEAFEIHAYNDYSSYGRVMRYEPTGSIPNIIGGYYLNSVGSGVTGAVIAGGGASGYPNTITRNTSTATIGGGDSNVVSADGGTIAGGHGGKVISLFATIGGGKDNIAGGGPNDAYQQTVGGGLSNVASGDEATIAGGEGNYVTGDHSAIAGGFQNGVTDSFSAILGGFENTVNGPYSSILGGEDLVLGDSSVGFNGTRILTNLDSNGYKNVGYFGNIDLWIGNVNDSARQLRFYAPNNDPYYGAASYFSAFKAGVQDTNIIYTLPITLPVTGQVLGATTTGTNVALSWMSGGGGGAGWALMGNSSVPPPTYYLGTQDSEAFEIHIHNNTLDTTRGNRRVMRYEEGSSSPNILGGSSANTLGMGLTGVAILSGGSIAYPNIISDSEKFCLIASGEGNLITGESEYSSIVGGRFNSIVASLESVVSGGYGNILSGDNSLIGSGFTDTLTGSASSIVGGTSNYLYGNQSTIAGGQGNQLYTGILGPSFLGGGQNNYLYTGLLSGPSFLGSGDSNVLTAGWATLGGGHRNIIDIGGEKGIIVGGCFNTVTQEWGIIVGGCGNTVTDTFGTIVGGDHDSVNAPLGTVGGGQLNDVDAELGTIGGGDTNLVTGYAGTISGGQQNQIASLAGNTTTAVFGTIAGGEENVIGPISPLHFGPYPSNYGLPYAATIGGGFLNTANGHLSTVGGGADNYALGAWSSIPGGVGLVAMDFQTVVGLYNDTTANALHNTDTFTGPYAGNLAIGYSANLPAGDYPLFIVGNGAAGMGRSNAFTVADAGYSSAYDNIGIGAANPTRMGSTYADNTIEAWGNAVLAVGGDTLASNIGVQSLTWVPGDTDYVVVLNIRNQDGSRHTFTQGNGSITTSIGLDILGGPAIIITSQLLTSGPPGITSTTPGFTVSTFRLSNGQRTNTFPFQFHVVAK